jgi:hypothetical protein
MVWVFNLNYVSRIVNILAWGASVKRGLKFTEGYSSIMLIVIYSWKYGIQSTKG